MEFNVIQVNTFAVFIQQFNVNKQKSIHYGNWGDGKREREENSS